MILLLIFSASTPANRRRADGESKYFGQNDGTNGAFYGGMFAAWEITKSQKIYDTITDHC
ncbi:MAG: glycoside hydrolase family 88 protein [Tannerella sp.]|jgi:rhamnogalacturonyl hydrolase YesR|nr:glycoside hydrolase family 88 protein [Tannerella sp.]